MCCPYPGPEGAARLASPQGSHEPVGPPFPVAGQCCLDQAPPDPPAARSRRHVQVQAGADRAPDPAGVEPHRPAAQVRDEEDPPGLSETPGGEPVDGTEVGGAHPAVCDASLLQSHLDPQPGHRLEILFSDRPHDDVLRVLGHVPVRLPGTSSAGRSESKEEGCAGSTDPRW